VPERQPEPVVTADLVDIGANLTHAGFRDDLPAVLARAAEAGVHRLVVTGTSVAASAAAADLASTWPGVLWATAGVHPHEATGYGPSTAAALRDLLTRPGVVATGECGLDYHRDFSPRPDQRDAFASQVVLAVESRKPLFLHQRDAHADFCAILGEHGSQLPAGVAHCFTGGPAELEAYLAMGLYIGITGWICDERRALALREAVRSLPLERVLVETDCPYLLPRTLDPAPRSRRNEPATLPEVVRVLAGFMDQDPAAVAAASTRNAVRLFGLSAPPTPADDRAGP